MKIIEDIIPIIPPLINAEASRRGRYHHTARPKSNDATVSCTKLCTAAPEILKPITETLFNPDKSRIITTDKTPAVSEKTSENGEEKSRAESKMRVIFTSSAPLKSLKHKRSRAIELASPNFTPGAIKERENRLSM